MRPGESTGPLSDDSPRINAGASRSDPKAPSEPGVHCSPTERPVGSRLSALTGTLNSWFARAFTQGSLPWNLQTRLGCSCAKELERVYHKKPNTIQRDRLYVSISLLF